MEVKDLTGLGGVATKLIDVVSEATGTLYRPRAIRNDARAEAEKLRVMERARAEAAEDAKAIALRGQLERVAALTNSDPSAVSRAISRLATREMQGLSNIEAIADAAMLALPASTQTGEPASSVDPDWMRRFFKLAEDVSDSEMQVLWGKILASEVSASGKVSVRTLMALHQMSQAEARMFERLAALATSTGYVFSENDQDLPNTFQIPREEITTLQAAGLLHPNVMEVAFPRDGTNRLEYPGGDFLEVQSSAVRRGVKMRSHYSADVMTPAGRELLKFAWPKETPPQYLKYICGYMLGSIVNGSPAVMAWVDKMAKTHEAMARQQPGRD